MEWSQKRAPINTFPQRGHESENIVPKRADNGIASKKNEQHKDMVPKKVLRGHIIPKKDYVS